MITNRDIQRARELAAIIRELKEMKYDKMTWEAAIEEVLKKHTTSEEAFLKQRALMNYLIDEEHAMESLESFLENVPAIIEDLKEKSKDYYITEEERQDIARKVDIALDRIPKPVNENNALDYCQLLIDSIFLTSDVESLLKLLNELAAVLKNYYPGAYAEAQMLGSSVDDIPRILEACFAGATRKEISATCQAEEWLVDLVTYRFAQIDVLVRTKKGRTNSYRLKSMNFTNNILRKEWDWLWSQQHKQISMKLYDK